MDLKTSLNTPPIQRLGDLGWFRVIRLRLESNFTVAVGFSQIQLAKLSLS